MVVRLTCTAFGEFRLSTPSNEGCARSFIRVWGISSNLSEGAPLDLNSFVLFCMSTTNVINQDRGKSSALQHFLIEVAIEFSQGMKTGREIDDALSI